MEVNDLNTALRPNPGEAIRTRRRAFGAALAFAALAFGGIAIGFGAPSDSKPGKGTSSSKSASKNAAKKPAATAASPLKSTLDEQPTMTLTGVHAVVSRTGEIREKIDSEWAQMGQTDHILTMKQVSTEFYNAGVKFGDTTSGAGTIWLIDQPDKGISRNDMQLSDQVHYKSSEGWELDTPAMHYSGHESMLTTSAGFTKMLNVEKNTIKATGQSFEIKLVPDGGSFKTYPKEHGNLLVYERIDQTGTQP